MSKAGASAARARRKAAEVLARLDAEHAQCIAYLMQDAALVRCDRCGLEQTERAITAADLSWATGCVMCGCLTASFVEDLAPSYTGVSGVAQTGSASDS